MGGRFLRSEIERRNRQRSEAGASPLDPDAEAAKLESAAREVAFERWIRANWDLYQRLMGDVSALTIWGKMARASRVRRVMRRTFDRRTRHTSGN
jgi:hypothetical protein